MAIKSSNSLTFKPDSARAAVRAIIEAIGDDPNRAGVIETPGRVVASWRELFSGYSKDVGSLFKTFGDHAGYNQIILCRDIEFYSTCEHHLLPFYGTAHVAYIPSKEVVGLSKLARVVDVYARRLQMQERIGQQVTGALEQYLKPKGSACIIKAKHLCMACRGVTKQHSSMVTSSLTGAFLKEDSARSELLSLIAL